MWQAAVLGLGWLIRPELVLLSGAFLVIVVGSQWRRASPQVVVRTVAAMVALPLLYQIFRMGYFGEPVTNTAIAKEGTDVELERGWGYLRNFADPYWLWVPVLVLVVGGYVPTVAGLWQEGHRRAVAVVVAVGGFAVVNAGYVTVVGGDYIHSRLLLPAFFAFCCPVAVVGVTRRNAAGLALVPWLLAAVLVLRPPQWEIDQHFTDDLVFFPTHRWMGRVTAEDARPDPAGWYQGDGFYLQQGFGMYERVDVDIRPGLPESIGAFSGVGLVSYTAPTDFYVLDTLGLANALVSHFESMPSTTIGQRLPGHEKPLPAPWVAALVTPEGAEVDPGDLTKSPDPLIPSTEGKAFDLQVAWARAALECDEIARLRDSAEAPMSPGRFLTNLVDSFSNWRLRIPPDPEQAYRKFCGKGVPPEVERVRAER